MRKNIETAASVMSTFTASSALLWLGVLMVCPPARIAAVEIRCHPANKADPLFVTSGGNYDPETVSHEDCIFACFLMAAPYAGIQAGHCLCGHTATPVTVDPSADCGQPCGGDPAQACGNDTHLAAPVAVIDALPPALSLAQAASGPAPVAGQAVVFEAGGVNASDSVELDLGDGSLVVQLTSAAAPSYVYVYWTSGQFLAVATATRNSLITARHAVPVAVAMEAAGVCIQCPVVVEIGEAFECSVEVVQGSNVTLTMSIDSIDSPDHILGSATFTLFGVIGLNGTQTLASDMSDAMWVLPATEAQQRTRLFAIEALITRLGSFKFLILKPSCATGAYCATDNTCKDASLCDYDTAANGGPLNQDTCGSGQAYCVARRGCAGATSCPAQPARFETNASLPIEAGRPGYEVVEVLTMDVAAPGLFRYNFTDAPCELLTLEVGYVLGLAITAIGAQIGTDPMQGATYKYKLADVNPSQGDVLPVANFELVAGRYLVRATTVTPLSSHSQFVFETMGDYDIGAAANNSITPSSAVNRTNVLVQIVIRGLRYEDYQPAVKPDEPITMEISVVNGSHINYTLDWEDGHVDTFYTLESVPFNVSHNYSVAGDYELNVTACNLISCQTILTVVIVQNPVLRHHFAVITKRSYVVEGNNTASPVGITITINPILDNKLLATAPQASFECLLSTDCPADSEDDLSSLALEASEDRSAPKSLQHVLTFFQFGVYSVRVNVSNLVSKEVYEVQLVLYERLTGVTTITRYRPSSSASSISTIGHGPSQDTFPLDRPVQFEMNIISGSDVKYAFDYGDGSPPGNYSHEDSPFEHSFPEIARYNVRIEGFNPATVAPVVLIVHVNTLRPIRAISILDLGVSRANETRSLALTLFDKGTNSCLVVDYGDSSPSEAYGESGPCVNHHNSRGELNASMTLTHVYYAQDTYTVLAMGSNAISSDNASLTIPVSEARKSCGLPAVSIEDSQPGWWFPKITYRKDLLVFQGIAKLNCWFTDNSKSWSLEQLDPQTGKLLEAETLALKQLTDTTSTLLVPPFQLDIGLYRLGYKVLMNTTLTDNLEFFSVGYDYIDVQRSRLHVTLLEGQMTSIVRGWGTMLDLRPGELSKDPDVPPEETDQGFEQIQYLCRQIGETYSATDYIVDVPAEKDYNATDIGGCFGSGPGILNSSEPTLSWNTSLMETGIRYVILVKIKKDIRNGNFTLILELKPGDPPQVVISIGQGTIYLPGNGAQIINPTGSVRLTASCTEFCDRIQYVWSLKGMNSTEYEFNLPGWETLTSGDLEFLYIQKELFTTFPQYSLFVVNASASNLQGGSGYASMKIQLNEPPVRGTCVATPPNVTAGETVRVTCEDWEDFEGIALYKFFAETSLFNAVLSTGIHPTVDLTPPLGSKSNGYMVALGLTAEDAIGATTTDSIANIRVSPPVGKRSENYSAEQTKLYNTLLAEGNPAEINAQLLLDASILIGAADDAATDESSEDAPTQTSEEISAAETERAEKTAIITQMAKLQASVVISSPEDIIQMASTISLITDDTSALSPAALDSLSGLADTMIDFVETDARSTKDESKLNNVGEGVINFVGNMLAGTAESVNNPTVSLTVTSTSTQSDNTEELQKESEEKAVATLIRLENVIQRLFSVVVANKLPGEYLTTFFTPNLKLSIDRNKAQYITNRTLGDGTGMVNLGDWCSLTGQEENCSSADDVIDMKLQSTPKNSYSFASGGIRHREDSGLVNFTFFGNNSQEVGITNLSEDALINIRFAQAAASAKEPFSTFNPTTGNGSIIHYIDVESPAETVFLELRPGNASAVYVLFMSFGETPTFDMHDFKFIIPVTANSTTADPTTANISSENIPSTTAFFSTSDPSLYSSTDSPWADANFSDASDAEAMEPVSHVVLFGPDQHEGRLGRYVFRLAELSPEGTPEENITMSYSLRILQVQCSYYESDTKSWLTEGLRVVLDAETKAPICQTSHLTPFTTTWIVRPVPLDFTKVFDNLSPLDNLTIYATCVTIYTVFFFIFMWARRKDKKDIMMLGLTPLPDNNPKHTYLYEVVIITGKRMNAGTNSKVSLVLSGEDDETPARTLEDPKRQILTRGSIDRFLLATAKPLGNLNYMRIWHDNSGQGASQSWYLSYIAVYDLQTKRRYFFICNEWFSLVEGDGQVDRLLPVAGKKQMQEFGHVFASQTGKNFNDSHLWISIVTRPPGSRFTRMQRAMCCLMALWLQMLTSIMFYKAAPDAPTQSVLNIGSFSLTPSEVAIGIEANLIVFPVSLLMVQIFKRSKMRKKRPSGLQAAKEAGTTKDSPRCNKVHPAKTRDDTMDTVSSRDVQLISGNEARIDVDPAGPAPDGPAPRSKPRGRKPKGGSLPWWFIYVGWVFCILTTLAATTFTFFYGLFFENEKTTEWLHSIVISFFCGIIVTQPIKVILVSLFMSLVFKTPTSDEDMDVEEDQEDCQLQSDEEWLHTIHGSSNGHPNVQGPLEPHVIEKQRIKRQKELKMYAIIREIMFSVIFVWILSIFSYGNQDPYAFWTKNAHVKLLVHGDGNNTFMKATSIPKFWRWVNTGLVPGMYAGPWHNDDPPSPDELNFLGDRYSKILGKVRFRQHRVQRGHCQLLSIMKDVVSECNVDYSASAQDETQYGPGWTEFDPSGPDYLGYKFTSKEELDSYPVWGRHNLYLGGGYVYFIDMDNLEATVAKMYEEAWIDRYTRVLFIEFSVYNAQTNLFSFINLMTEILPTGGSYPHYRIDILRLLTYHEGIGLVRVICEATFFVFIICMTVKELLLIGKEGKKYFKVFWNLNELAIISLSIVTMVVYFIRLFVTNALLGVFANKAILEKVNLQYVAYWNELMGYLLGVLVFLSTLKFLKLLRFNRRIGLLSSTIRSCSNELFNFTFMFSFVFVAFASAFYLIFCNRLINYSDLLFTIETMVTAVLGKFKFGELLVTESVLGPLFFFGFTGYVCFIMINLFLTIIIEAFKTVKMDINKQSNEYEMVEFILQRFKAAVGVKSKKVMDEDLPNLDMEEYEADIAKSLPDKVDQLMAKIAHNYFDKGTFDNFIQEVSAQEKKREQSKKTGRRIFLS